MRHFVEKVTAKRQECADRGETAMSACYKLVVNSSYGRLGMNLSKRVKTKFVPAKNLNKELKKSRFLRCQPISDDSDIFEVSLKKVTQTDWIPVQACKFFLALFILKLLKFKLFKFYRPPSCMWSSLSEI